MELGKTLKIKEETHHKLRLFLVKFRLKSFDEAISELLEERQQNGKSN